MLIVLLILLIGLSSIMLSRDRKENSQSKGEEAEATEQTEQWEKGYNLPLDTQKKKDAEEECSAAMELISSQYQNMDKGNTSDGVLSDEEIVALKEVLKEDGLTVTGADAYSTMENYETMEDFLADCQDGKEGTMVLYKVKSSGGLNRTEFEYDGEDLYVVDTISEWSGDGEPVISSTSYTRVKWWNYTEKGWLSPIGSFQKNSAGLYAHPGLHIACSVSILSKERLRHKKATRVRNTYSHESLSSKVNAPLLSITRKSLTASLSSPDVICAVSASREIIYPVPAAVSFPGDSIALIFSLRSIVVTGSLLPIFSNCICLKESLSYLSGIIRKQPYAAAPFFI